MGYLEGALMISETTVMMLIAIQFGFMAFVLMKIELKKGEKIYSKSEPQNNPRNKQSSRSLTCSGQIVQTKGPICRCLSVGWSSWQMEIGCGAKFWVNSD